MYCLKYKIAEADLVCPRLFLGGGCGGGVGGGGGGGAGVGSGRYSSNYRTYSTYSEGQA